ncbi:MAG: hypothetical protein H6Q25_1156 [Bacteroidetes bacterium]|nr:hypothetical protein [Bacteroidota bacterium]
MKKSTKKYILTKVGLSFEVSSREFEFILLLSIYKYLYPLFIRIWNESSVGQRTPHYRRDAGS